MKKKLTMCLSVALIAVMAICGTLAYLTSTDSDVNVMTLGNVKIEQIEQERDANNNLVEFTQGKPAYPAVGPIEWADNGVDVNGTEYKVFTDDLKNVIDKIVTVKNTGKSDAYVRTIIMMEAPDGDPNDLIHVNVNGDDKVVEKTAWSPVTIGGIDYVYSVFTYVEPLEAGKISAPSLMQVFLDSKATNEDCAKFGEEWEILVVSQAVQTEGFDDAQTALNTGFGEVNKDNVAKWFAGMSNVKYIELEGESNQITDEAAAGILTDLQNGQNMMLDENVDILAFDAKKVDAKGATVTLNGQGAGAYGYLAFLPDAGEEVSVSNLNVTGSGFVEVGHWGMGDGNYTVENVKIENLASTLANRDKGFTLACAFCHYGNATLKNCVMTGATAVQEGAIPVDLGCVNDTTTTIEGGEYGTVYCWSHSVVTIKEADIDCLYAAPIKGTVTVKAGTHIKTLNVDYGTSDTSDERLAKLIIEDGASVDKIVLKAKNNPSQTYTLAEWKNR